MNLIEIHVSEAIASLQYDFREYSLDHFLGHLKAVQQREIFLRSCPFDLRLGGAWVHADTAEYIFYNSRTPRFHQAHQVLHESGHIVLGHMGQETTPEALEQLGIRLEIARGQPLYALYRITAPHGSILEREAETFVRLMQLKILQANRLDQLTGSPSSLDAISPFTRSLGYSE
jgi:hypothetical protein